MKVLIASAILSMLPNLDVSGQDIFGPWMIFPGPNPDTDELLPDRDTETCFRIGQVIFDYPFDRFDKIYDPVHELSELQSVADVVKAATVGPALVALAEQQLGSAYEFEFEEAAVLDYGDVGFVWNVTYALYPRVGGFSGIPFRYRATLDGQGHNISPRMTIFDAYFHSPKIGWTCSVLTLPEKQAAKEEVLDADAIRNRAIESLRKSNDRTKNDSPLMTIMKYQNQKLINIPVATLADGKIANIDLWAVNFRDSSRKERPEEVFTVWVTKAGRTAEIRHLDHWWKSDEQQDEPVLPDASDPM